MTVARCIAVDWGTSSLRAALLGDGGEALERVSRPKGILAVPERVANAKVGSIFTAN